MPGRNNAKGIGTMSDPWDYDPESVKRGHERLSTHLNHQSLVRPFDKQMPRTKYGSIYTKLVNEANADPIMPNDEEKETIRVRGCASEARHQRISQSRNHGREQPIKSLSSFKRRKPDDLMLK